MWIFEKGRLTDALTGSLLIKCKTDIDIRSVPVVSVCHRMGKILAQLWPPGFVPWWPFFIMQDLQGSLIADKLNTQNTIRVHKKTSDHVKVARLN